MARQGPKDAQDFARMSREYAELTRRSSASWPAIGPEEQADLAALAADPAGDPEMKSMAEEELRATQAASGDPGSAGQDRPSAQGTRPTNAAPS